jgi:hypothetical protein
MTYAQYGLVQASDYNTLVGSSPSSTANTINTTWSVGSGARGYGQTALNQVSATSTVTATQWSTLIGTVDSMLKHQAGGSGTSISLPTSGNTISYLGTLTGAVATAYSNALNFNSNSAVVAGSGITAAWTASISNAGSNPPVAQTSRTSLTRSFGLTATFGSPDKARYFFNAGGRLKYNISGAQNASTTARTNEIISLLGFLGGVQTFGANTNGGRSGSGGTLGTNDTAKGYWVANPTWPTSNVTLVSVTSTVTNYTADTGYIQYKTNGYSGMFPSNPLNSPPATGQLDNGNVVTFWTTVTSNSGTDYNGNFGFDDSFGVTVTQSIDVSYPETTNLANTWGAVVITAASDPW